MIFYMFRCLWSKKCDGLKSCVKSSLVCLIACPPPLAPGWPSLFKYSFYDKKKIKGRRREISFSMCQISMPAPHPGRRIRPESRGKVLRPTNVYPMRHCSLTSTWFFFYHFEWYSIVVDGCWRKKMVGGFSHRLGRLLKPGSPSLAPASRTHFLFTSTLGLIWIFSQ